MSRITLTLGILLVSLVAMAGCAAPSTNAPATGNLAGSTPPEPASPPAAPAPPPQASPGLARAADGTVVINTRCRTSADCAVKDVGNCCGTMPACVNKDSPTDPAAVQAQCKAKGMMGVCGFQELTACQCSAGQCVSAGPANPEPSVDPAEPVR